jgi:hypothetical protein
MNKEPEIYLITPKRKEETLLAVPSIRYAAINKSEMNALLDKYRELGIRTTEEKITSYIFNHLQKVALENDKHAFTDEEIYALWKRYKRTVFKLTPEKIIKLAGFDPLIFSKPAPQSRK